MGQYRALFNITVEHTYFSGDRCSGFEFIPVPATARLVANTNLVVKQRPDGVSVFFDSAGVEALGMYAANDAEPLRLNFECVATQEKFPVYTGSSVFAKGRVLFFDSSNTPQGATGRKNLHTGDFASAADLVDCYPGSPGLFEQYASYLVFSGSRTLLFDKEQTDRNPQGKTSLNRQDFASEEAAAKAMAPTAGVKSRQASPVALVSILITADYLQKLNALAATVCEEYCIRFEARETYWKYFLLGDIKRESAFVKDLDNSAEFEFSGEVSLADARTALTFTSKQLIPLRDRTKCRFQLQEMKNGRGKVLVSRLPVASANRINREMVEGRELIVSEIYINY